MSNEKLFKRITVEPMGEIEISMKVTHQRKKQPLQIDEQIQKYQQKIQQLQVKYNNKPLEVKKNEDDVLNDFNIPAMNRKNEIVSMESPKQQVREQFDLLDFGNAKTGIV